MMSVMIPELADLSWIDEMRRDVIRWIWTYPLLVVLVLVLTSCSNPGKAEEAAVGSGVYKVQDGEVTCYVYAPRDRSGVAVSCLK